MFVFSNIRKINFVPIKNHSISLSKFVFFDREHERLSFHKHVKSSKQLLETCIETKFNKSEKTKTCEENCFTRSEFALRYRYPEDHHQCQPPNESKTKCDHCVFYKIETDLEKLNKSKFRIDN